MSQHPKLLARPTPKEEAPVSYESKAEPIKLGYLSATTGTAAADPRPHHSYVSTTTAR